MTTTPTIFKGLLPRGEPGVAPLKVPGVLVELQSGLYFCATEPVILHPQDWFDIEGEDCIQLSEYGYPEDLKEKVGLELEPIQSVWAREDLEVNHGFILGWYPDERNEVLLRGREAKAAALASLREDTLREEVRRRLRTVLEGISAVPE